MPVNANLIINRIVCIVSGIKFIAILNGDFIGYQAAIKTGNYLNALYGAFDRTLKSNYHACDILFVKMAEFAIENGLKICDFGAVLNFTKQRMVNTTIESQILYYTNTI